MKKGKLMIEVYSYASWDDEKLVWNIRINAANGHKIMHGNGYSEKRKALSAAKLIAGNRMGIVVL